jgi:hypothetical protein
MADATDKELKSIAAELQGLEVRFILASGALFDKAKETLNKAGRASELDGWIKSLRISRRTAFNRIGAYRHFNDVDPAILCRIELSALYDLSQRSAAKRARLEALKLAREGKPVKRAKARELIKKHLAS